MPVTLHYTGADSGVTFMNVSQAITSLKKIKIHPIYSLIFYP